MIEDHWYSEHCRFHTGGNYCLSPEELPKSDSIRVVFLFILEFEWMPKKVRGSLENGYKDVSQSPESVLKLSEQLIGVRNQSRSVQILLCIHQVFVQYHLLGTVVGTGHLMMEKKRCDCRFMKMKVQRQTQTFSNIYISKIMCVCNYKQYTYC